MNATQIAAQVTAQQPHFGATVWTMRDGTRTEVAAMTPSHAANAVAMLERSTRRMLSALIRDALFHRPLGTLPDDVEAETDRRFEELVEVRPEDVLAATVLGAALYARAAETTTQEVPVGVESSDLRDSVRDYREPRTTDAERDVITSWWQSIGVANQVAAMLCAAELDRAAQR